MKDGDLFHTYCHHCRELAHCWPVLWRDEWGKWRVLLLCPVCRRKRALAV